MSDWVLIESDPKHVRRERSAAQALRASRWWQQQIQKGLCHYCQNAFAPELLTMDHLVPISRGGRSTEGNCVPCCKECNNRKAHLTPAEMILNRLKEFPGNPQD